MEVAVPGVKAHWEGRTVRQLQSAQAGKDISSAVRQHTEHTTRVIESENMQTLNNVTLSLQKKVSQTTTMKAKLDKSVSALTEEMAQLSKVRDRTERVLQEQSVPLGKAQVRLFERGKRPSRENINDDVTQILMVDAAERASAMRSLVRYEADIHDLLKRMESCLAILRRDLNDKRQALELDRSCLAVSASSPRSPEVDSVLTNILRRAASDVMSTAGYNPRVAVDMRHLSRESHHHPTEWKQGTTSEVVSSQQMIKESKLLRKKVMLHIKHIRSISEQCEARTKEVFTGKIRSTDRLCKRIAAKLADIDRELDDLATAKQRLVDTIAQKEEPLQQCIQRLNLRRKRPDRETVRDEAEQCLHSQLDTLLNSIRSLEAHHNRILEREAALRKMKADLESDKNDKLTAKDIDTSLMNLESCSPPVGSPLSAVVKARYQAPSSSVLWKHRLRFSPSVSVGGS